MNEKKVNSKKKLKKIGEVILIIMIVFLIEYSGMVVYRYATLGKIHDKSKKYENIQNIYIEEVKISRNENKQRKVANAKYWYKDNILKTEIDIQEEKSYKIHTWMDFQKTEGYILVEKGENKTGTKVEGQEIYKRIKEGRIIEYLNGSQVNFSENKFSNAIKLISMRITTDENYSYVIQKNMASIYDIQTGLLVGKKMNVGNNEYINTYYYEIGNVKDEDIRKIDMLEYKIEE